MWQDGDRATTLQKCRALEFSRDYATLTAEVDISRVSEKRRDPDKVLRLMQSLARNISTEVSVATLAADVRGSAGGFKEETAADYLDARKRLLLVEDLPAWNAHIRSSATLRQMPKRHFADPSLACGILRIDTAKTPAARALVVVTGNGFAHRRHDGVFVVPITTLTA
jgi:predicted AAA+ superfamily ATPase